MLTNIVFSFDSRYTNENKIFVGLESTSRFWYPNHCENVDRITYPVNESAVSTVLNTESK